MAVLTAKELTDLRHDVSRDLQGIMWLKEGINDALQAIEDWFSSPAIQANLSSAIDGGTMFSFTNEQKKKMVKFWLRNRFGRE